MLDDFLENFIGLHHLDNFVFDEILSDDGRSGNLLGEFMLFYNKVNLEAPWEIHPILSPIFIEFVFGYPYVNWNTVIESHPDWESDCECCQRIKVEKLFACSVIWAKRGFTITSPGEDDTLSTQVHNAKVLLAMTSLERKKLINLTQTVLFLSGMFGKHISLDL